MSSRVQPQPSGVGFSVADLIPASTVRRARPSPITTSSISSSSSRRQHPYDQSARSSQFSHSPLSRSLPSSRRIPSTAMSTPTPTTPPSVSTPVLSSPSGSMNASGGKRRKAAPLFPSPRTMLRTAPEAAYSPITSSNLRGLHSANLPRDQMLRSAPESAYTPITSSNLRGSTSASLPREQLVRPGYPRPPVIPPGMRFVSAPSPLPLSATRSSICLETPTFSKRVKLEGADARQIVAALHNVAHRFWELPHTADCSVLVPLTPTLPRPRRAATPLSSTFFHSRISARATLPPMPRTAALAGEHRGQTLPSIVPRRGSAPAAMVDTRMKTYPLHLDYLASQSSLFRALLNTARGKYLPGPAPTTEAKAKLMRTPTIKGARIIPTPHGRPTFYVPLPDPASFPILLHYMYWGNARELEESLNKGEASWSGLVKNMEYLGLDDNPKRIVGRWWRKWVKVAAGRPAEANPMLDKAYQGASDDEDSGGVDDGADADEEDEGDVSPQQDPEDDRVAGLLNRL